MTLDDNVRKKKQRARSVAIALGLGVLVLIFYASAIINVGKALETRRTQIEKPKS